MEWKACVQLNGTRRLELARIALYTLHHVDKVLHVLNKR